MVYVNFIFSLPQSAQRMHEVALRKEIELKDKSEKINDKKDLDSSTLPWKKKKTETLQLNN